MPCFLASFADTLPLLLADPVLHPYLSTPDSWPSSPSLFLRSASAAFLRITSLPTFAPTADSFTPIHQSVHSLLTTPTGSQRFGPRMWDAPHSADPPPVETGLPKSYL